MPYALLYPLMPPLPYSTASAGKAKQFVFLHFAVVVLSIYVLLALLADSFFRLPREVSRLLQYADNGICVFFLVEFSIRFYHAPSKARFMRWGWLDLIASIPTLDFLRAGRVVRLLRLLRLLRAFRSTSTYGTFVHRNKAQSLFFSVALFALLMILLSAVAILLVEDAPTSNIKTAGDAMWWAYVTITTVGYGDFYPVTPAGRLLAAILMTTGVGLFGTFTGFVSSWFLSERHDEAKQ